jgi:hypothetical protein
MDRFQKPILLYPTNYKNSLKYNKGMLKRGYYVPGIHFSFNSWSDVASCLAILFDKREYG